jgi:peptidoglycan/LPS O-acetylase OafA/YrhL
VSYAALLVVDRYRKAVRADFVFGRTTQVLIACGLVGLATYGFRGVIGRALEMRAVAYVGKISYGIYIFHNLVPVAFARFARYAGISYTDVARGTSSRRSW